jgi:uroporphyrin-III C-methyltransferase
MRFANVLAMGKVFLIGAGPGDPELMTLKAARALRLADVVLIDDLVNRGCLAHVRSDSRVIAVGKRGGCKSTSQVFIHKTMVDMAGAGHTVARLKGGDPFVFGRGGEEMQALLEAGIEVEVIPGVTAGTAVPASLGIPLTQRGLAQGVTFVTGHGAVLDWRALVAAGTTLVFYMGLSRLRNICEELEKAGMPPTTPACVIENGTTKRQRQVIGTLASLPADGLSAPALIVVGQVVRFAKRAAAREAKAA